MNGYGGRILFADLSKNEFIKTPLPEKIAKDYIGGRGLATYLLYCLNRRFVPPFSPENFVIVASGPLSGILAPAAGKIDFTTKSPLTGGFGNSNMGGHMAAELKYAGYDAIAINGKCQKPSILVIDDDKIEIRDASKYWGVGCLDAEKMLKDDLGSDFQIAVIGPAAENGVRFACISHDFGRQAGRCGIGTVLGSKNIKAICVHGTKSIPLFDTEAVIKKGLKMFETCAKEPATKVWGHLGTPGVTMWVNEIGALPVRNFQDEHLDLENCKNLSGEVMRKEIVLHDKACGLCPMACGKYSRAKKESKYDVHVEGPEYETIALCGSNCGITDIRDVAYINHLLDQLGIDTISGGAVVAFAMECFEKSIITKGMTGGQELKFGDLNSFVWLAKKIAKREDIGAILSYGVKEASQILGGGSEKFAIHVKGLEQSGYGIRNALAMMLSYITSIIGAHHSDSWAITWDEKVGRELLKGKAGRVIFLQHIRPLFDMLGACRLLWVETGFALKNYPEILNHITGFDFTLKDLLKASERTWNLARMFWKREIPDFDRGWDQLPARFLEEEVPTGSSAGKKVTQAQIDYLLKDYYCLRGWDSNGIPTKEKLLELGLDFVVEDLYY